MARDNLGECPRLSFLGCSLEIFQHPVEKRTGSRAFSLAIAPSPTFFEVVEADHCLYRHDALSRLHIFS